MRITEGRYRFQSVKNKKLYLGIQDNLIYTNGGSLALVEHDQYKGSDILKSSQVWYLIDYKYENQYMMINQLTGYLACIRGRSTENNATAIQYYTQLVEYQTSEEISEDTYQEWIPQAVTLNSTFSSHTDEVLMPLSRELCRPLIL